MLLNQVALAEHFCRVAPHLHGTHAELTGGSGTSPARCHGSPNETVNQLPDLGQIACGVHCNDADKQVRDVVSPIFPALIGPDPELTLLRSARSSGPLATDPRSADAVRDRHGSIYRVLLI